MLKPQLQRIASRVASQIVGTCDAIDEDYWGDKFGIDLDQIYEILQDQEVERCVGMLLVDRRLCLVY